MYSYEKEKETYFKLYKIRLINYANDHLAIRRL